ncbi:MAG: cation:proton antiporter, partial [Acidimicrobiia bacterium]|nr:cation:proton antiporter [Acidimicrobiia bacterium]
MRARLVCALGAEEMNLTLIAAAESSSAPLDEHQVLLLLIQLLALVGLARLLGGLMKRIGQPSVVGELLAGVVLGPSLFGKIAPAAYEWVFTDEPVVTSTVFGFAWLGVIMLLVVIGFETDLAIIRRFAKAAIFVSAGSLLIPLATGVTMGLLAPESFRGEGADPGIFAGFFALALAVSALPVVAKILLDLGFLRRNFGQITLAAGMTMDSVGWLLLAALAGISRENRLDLPNLARSIGGLALFLILAATVGRWGIDQTLKRIMASGSSTAAALTITLLAAITGAMVTQALELEAILGAFIVGILLATTRHQVVSVRDSIENLTAAFFAPIFFAFSGLRVDIGALASAEAALWAFGVVVVAILAKVGGTYIGARLGGLDR